MVSFPDKDKLDPQSHIEAVVDSALRQKATAPEGTTYDIKPSFINLGELVMDEEMCRAAEEAVYAGKKKLVFNMEGVKYVSSGFFTTMDHIRKGLSARNVDVVLIAMTPTMKELFDITNFGIKFGDGYKPGMTPDQAREQWAEGEQRGLMG